MTESRASQTGSVPALGEVHQNVRVLFTADQIAARVRELGLDVARELGATTHRPLFVGVLKGAFVFMSDLAWLCMAPIGMDKRARSHVSMQSSAWKNG